MKNNFKKVLILSQYYLPEKGAPQIRLSTMAKVMAKKGFDISVLTGIPNYPDGIILKEYQNLYNLNEEIEDIKIYRSWLYPASGKNKIKRLINYLSFTCSSTIKIFFLPKPDIVFVEGQPLTLAFPAFLYKIFKGVPYIYNTPDLQVEYARDDKWLPSFFPWFASKIEKFFMHQAFSVTTVTHAFINHFAKVYNVPYSKISFLPNGADTNILYPSEMDQEYKNKMGVNGKFIFTYCGTMAPYQGLETIMLSAELLKYRDDISFLMIGDGPIKNTIMNIKNEKELDNVIFSDSPVSEMNQLMSITYASIVVLRSLEISKKMRLSKTIPPLACGVPVIFSGWGETADIIKENNAGIVTEPEDFKMLASAITDLADNPSLRDKYSTSAHKLAKEQFDWENIINEWIKQIEDINNGREPYINRLKKDF